MIRILQVVNDMHRAGLETMLMNYYRNIDRTRIQFDFLTHRPIKSDYDDEIISLGGKVYYAPRLYPQNYIKYFKYMKVFFSEHPEYKIIHSHIDAMSYLPLLAAKNANVPIRIAHSHNTAVDKDFKYLLKQYYRKKITAVANTYFACGQEAGNFLFGKEPFTVIPNAIDADKFYFNSDIRKEMRNMLQIDNQFVIGHVGRFSYQKNHDFLVEIFAEIKKLDKSALLMLIGVGEKEAKIRNKVKKLGLEDDVKFLGNRDDVYKLYQAIDVFVLPSHFEGVPVVGVEAQFSDLPCIFSDNVPKEVCFNSKSSFMSLSDSSAAWAREIIKIRNKNVIRTSDNRSIEESNFNIAVSKSILEKYYLELMR